MADVSSHSTPDSVEPNPNFIKWLKQNCVPILGLVSGALVLCLVGHYGSTTVDWTKTKDFTEAFVNVTQSLALIAAGLWAYFKFAKGRTFRDRLTPSVSGKFVSIDDSVFLVVTMQLKNVGLSRIAFDKKRVRCMCLGMSR
jgi:Transcriptional regulator containing an amidase domain and an AraC-type DNA-binding HTH domain